jgi:hypothetical protein
VFRCCGWSRQAHPVVSKQDSDGKSEQRILSGPSPTIRRMPDDDLPCWKEIATFSVQSQFIFLLLPAGMEWRTCGFLSYGNTRYDVCSCWLSSPEFFTSDRDLLQAICQNFYADSGLGWYSDCAVRTDLKQRCNNVLFIVSLVG